MSVSVKWWMPLISGHTIQVFIFNMKEKTKSIRIYLDQLMICLFDRLQLLHGYFRRA